MAARNSCPPLDFLTQIRYTEFTSFSYAGVVELADARDSKSRVREDVRVRPPPPARVRIPGFVFAAERGFGFFIYSAHPVKYKRERMTSMKELRRKRAVVHENAIEGM